MRKISFPSPARIRRKPIAILSTVILVIFGIGANQGSAAGAGNGVHLGSAIKKHTPIEVTFRNTNYQNKMIALFLKKGSGSIKLGSQRLAVDGKAHFCAPQVI